MDGVNCSLPCVPGGTGREMQKNTMYSTFRLAFNVICILMLCMLTITLHARQTQTEKYSEQLLWDMR